MSQRRKREYFVAHEDELPDGARRIVTVRGVEIGVFNISGRYFALPNLCIHQWGPLCTGKIAGTLVAREENNWKLEWVKDGEILICPWHAMEYDITTGQNLSRPKVKLRHYPVKVEDGEVRVIV